MLKVDLRNCRTSKNINIKELSKRTGISKTTLYDIENGCHTPSLYNYTKLCIALDIDPFNELLTLKK